MTRQRVFFTAIMGLTTLLLFNFARCSQPTAAAAAVLQPEYQLRDLRRLDWLTGNWRGTAPGEDPFYEGYAFSNDSTLAVVYFADSSLRTHSGTAVVALRDNKIVHEVGNARWTLDRIDDDGWHFVPATQARNAFTWQRISRDEWQATLKTPEADGSMRTVTYRMERIASFQ